MLKNAHLLAKIDADTAENEQHCAEIHSAGGSCAAAVGVELVAALVTDGNIRSWAERRLRPMVDDREGRQIWAYLPEYLLWQISKIFANFVQKNKARILRMLSKI